MLGAHKITSLLASRWQAQERAQLLKGRKLHEQQSELEDALIDLKVSSFIDLCLDGAHAIQEAVAQRCCLHPMSELLLDCVIPKRHPRRMLALGQNLSAEE